MNEFIIPIVSVSIPLIAFGWGAKYFVQKEDYKEDKTEIKHSIEKLSTKIDDQHSKILGILTKKD